MGIPRLTIVSGGQTGVDRAALDAALEAGLPCGGWVPKGRRAEDGRIPDKYPVRECDSEDYATRTELNVENSDATLILFQGEMTGGTLLTHELCKRHAKPVLTLDLSRLSPEEAATEARDFIRRRGIQTLNVAGPRESGSPGIHAASVEVLRLALRGGY